MPKSFLLLVMAAGCGLVAMLGLRQLMSDESDAKPKSIKVLVAKSDIKAYVPLTENLVEFQERPADQVPIGAVQTASQYQRRALRQAAVKGEVILTSKLGEPGDFKPSTEIPKGYRVHTVPVTATSSHSGQIRPGDRVDIFVTYTAKDDPADRTALMTTKLILEYVEVFAMGADRNSETAADDQILAKNVSLLVTPEQAAILMMAQRKGEIGLTLRPKDDDEMADIETLNEIDFNNLGTNYSQRLKKEFEEKLANQEKELTEKHQQELNELDQKTAVELQQTLADFEQKYIEEQKRRDEVHAQTLAGLEAKNVELQTLLSQAIAASENKDELAKRLQALKTENGNLQQLLEDARKQAESAQPLLVPKMEIVPEKWQIKVLSGKQESISEFEINSEKSENESQDGTSTDSKPVEEEPSTK